MHPRGADVSVDPVPRGEGRDRVHALRRGPVLESGVDDLHLRELRPQHVGQVGAELDGRDLRPEGDQALGGLPGAGADLDHRASWSEARQLGEVGEQLCRVVGPRTLVERAVAVEDRSQRLVSHGTSMVERTR